MLVWGFVICLDFCLCAVVTFTFGLAVLDCLLSAMVVLVVG